MRITKSTLISMALLSSAMISNAQDAEKLFESAAPSVFTIQTNSATGSGWQVRDGNTIATCAHVVEGAREVKVVTQDDKTFVVKTMAIDKANDIAILIVDKPTGRKPLSLIDMANVHPGQKVFAIGNPLGGLPSSITDGIVSAVRTIESTQVVQFTAAISPGSSGSPVMNANGLVIGMATGYLRDGQMLNLAVSATHLRKALTLPQGPVTGTRRGTKGTSDPKGSGTGNEKIDEKIKPKGHGGGG